MLGTMSIMESCDSSKRKTTKAIKFKYCTDYDNSLINSVFRLRNWKKVDPAKDWNLFWSSGRNARFIYQSLHHTFNENQLINHFPNHYELVRKDALVRNIIRYRKELEKESNPLAEKEKVVLHKGVTTMRYKYLDFIPTTFVLPVDYVAFVKEYHKYPEAMWILKPVWSSNGDGIFLIQNLKKLKKWSRKKNTSLENQINQINKQNYVISRYIDNPLLIGGKKFDLRIYVLVASFRPLKAYMYSNGFCRFSTMKYDKCKTNFNNVFIHLTNVSVQRRGSDYNCFHGGKLGLNQLKLYLEGTRGKAVTERLFEEIKWLIVHSLKAVAPVIHVEKHCFECYGYDIIVDTKLKPWLIEVNSSPSFVATTDNDHILKSKLIDNLLSIVLPPKGIPDARWRKIPNDNVLGDFERLIDEDLMKK